MQIPILSVVLALGLPGANSCSAQQQGLPRVNQNPPAETQDEEDVDEPEEMDDSDMELAEVEELQAEESACDEAHAKVKTECKVHCEGVGSDEVHSIPLLGQLFKTSEHAKVHNDTLALGGQVVHIDEDDLDGRLQTLSIQPGSTVILQKKNGEQVVLRAQDADSLLTTSVNDGAPLMALRGLGYTSQAAPQKQDDRVRELEKRVRELEAQLRERDGQDARAPLAARLRSNQAHAEARGKAAQEREAARELHTRMSAMARDHAAQARQQAEEIRRQTEVWQKQAHDQQLRWKVVPQEGQEQDVYKWKSPKAPKEKRAAAGSPFDVEVYAEAMPPEPAYPGEAPVAPMAPMAVPDLPPTPEVYDMAPGVAAPRPRAARTPQPPRGLSGAGGEQVQDLQRMLNDMRRQMDEMREQMQALRQELERAPQREMR